MSLFDNLEEEEILEKSPVIYTYSISRIEAINFLKKQIRTYDQFKGFPESHPSTRNLRRTAAIYNYILENLK